MRGLVLTFGLALLAAPALAQAPAPAGAAPAAAEPPVCTTVTTVVKKGDVVLSTKSETKCERTPGERGSGEGGVHPGEILGSIGSPFGSLFTSTPTLQEKEARGDWRVVERGNLRVCHAVLMSETNAQGRRVRTSDCIGPLARAAAWKLEDNSVGIYGKDGALVVRLTGDRNRLAGQTADGQPVTLQR